MLPKIKSRSPTSLRIFPSDSANPIVPNPNPNPINIRDETIKLALLVLKLDQQSYNILDIHDLIYYKVETQEQVHALNILVYYKKN